MVGWQTTSKNKKQQNGEPFYDHLWITQEDSENIKGKLTLNKGTRMWFRKKGDTGNMYGVLQIAEPSCPRPLTSFCISALSLAQVCACWRGTVFAPSRRHIMP